MKKFLTLSLAVVVIAGVVFVVSPAKADTISDLLAQIAALQAQLCALSPANCGPVPPTPVICVDLPRDLYIGSEGKDVSQLQQFLMDRSYLDLSDYGNKPTGYFGNMTLAAVQKFQGANGLYVTKGVDSTTRAKIKELTCGTTPISQDPVITGVSGPNSLAVGQMGTWTLNVTAPAGAQLEYQFDWGDNAIYSNTLSLISNTAKTEHAYYTAGTYTVTLQVRNNNNQKGGGNWVTTTMTVVVGQLNSELVISGADNLNWGTGKYSSAQYFVSSNTTTTPPAGCASATGYSPTTGTSCSSAVLPSSGVSYNWKVEGLPYGVNWSLPVCYAPNCAISPNSNVAPSCIVPPYPYSCPTDRINLYTSGNVQNGTYDLIITAWENNVKMGAQDSKKVRLVVSNTSQNPADPVITGVSGPNSLAVGQMGTWTINITAPAGAQLQYMVDWGEPRSCSVEGGCMCTSGLCTITQTSPTFTHAYQAASTYSVAFNVRRADGYSCPNNGTVCINPNKWVTLIKTVAVGNNNITVPAITSVSTPVNKGDTVVITGTNFNSVEKVVVGQVVHTRDYFASQTDSQIELVLPQLIPGSYQTNVINAAGIWSNSKPLVIQAKYSRIMIQGPDTATYPNANNAQYSVYLPSGANPTKYYHWTATSLPAGCLLTGKDVKEIVSGTDTVAANPITIICTNPATGTYHPTLSAENLYDRGSKTITLNVIQPSATAAAISTRLSPNSPVERIVFISQTTNTPNIVLGIFSLKSSPAGSSITSLKFRLTGGTSGNNPIQPYYQNIRLVDSSGHQYGADPVASDGTVAFRNLNIHLAPDLWQDFTFKVDVIAGAPSGSIGQFILYADQDTIKGSDDNDNNINVVDSWAISNQVTFVTNTPPAQGTLSINTYPQVFTIGTSAVIGWTPTGVPAGAVYNVYLQNSNGNIYRIATGANIISYNWAKVGRAYLNNALVDVPQGSYDLKVCVSGQAICGSKSVLIMPATSAQTSSLDQMANSLNALQAILNGMLGR